MCLDYDLSMLLLQLRRRRNGGFKEAKKEAQLDFVATKEQFHHSACLQETLGNRNLSSTLQKNYTT